MKLCSSLYILQLVDGLGEIGIGFLKLNYNLGLLVIQFCDLSFCFRCLLLSWFNIVLDLFFLSFETVLLKLHHFHLKSLAAIFLYVIDGFLLD